jgi:hypothetical protein
MEAIWNGLTPQERKELLAPSYRLDLLMYSHVLDRVIVREWDMMHKNDQTIFTAQAQANRSLVSEELQAKINRLESGAANVENTTETAQATANRFHTPITIIQANWRKALTWNVCAELAAKRAAQVDGTCIVTILPDDWFITTIVDKTNASDYNAALLAPAFWAAFANRQEPA